jgi:hypothetical protein
VKNGASEEPPDVVVCSSGSLAHVYFTIQPGRMTGEAIEAQFPGLINGLRHHPGIGVLLVRADADHALALGADGWFDLTAGELHGSDPLADYGPRSAENLSHLEAFPNAGDLILLGAFDRASGEVTGFEELVGSHGGLGGWQAEPFILCPPTLPLADHPPIGSPALYRQLTTWQHELRDAQPE